jgi:N-acetylmuramoyl-L-alanine amidase
LKKALALVLVAVLLLASGTAFAAKNQKLILLIDGKQITYDAPPVTLKLNGKVLNTDVPAVILEDRTLVPIRVISESTGADVEWNGDTYEVTINTRERIIKLKINSSEMLLDGQSVKLDVPAKIINDRTMVPVRAVSEVLGLEVDWDPSTYSVLLNYPKADILDMSYDAEDEAVVLKTNGNVMYQTIFLQEPDRLVVDFPNTVFRSQTNSIEIGQGNMIRARASQFEVDPDISRVVIDLTGPLGYSISFDEEENLLKIRMANAVKGIYFDRSGSRNKVTIDSTSRLEYQSIVLEQPDRIVIDLPNTYLAGEPWGTVQVGMDGIRAIRYSQFEQNTVRAVIDLDQPLQYTIETGDSGLVVYLDGSPLDEIEYVETGWKTSVLSINTGREVKYKVEYSDKDSALVIEIPGNRAKLESGELFINNGVVDRIQVIAYDDDRDAGYITVFLKDGLRYQVTSPSRTDRITIELSGVPAEYQDMLVAIDAGHGGSDPGASRGGIKEKDLNLDLSFRLKALLEGMGFRTLMIRESDVFVDLYERAAIANEANADLYISVHFNAHDTNSTINGVETLYYPSSKNPLDNRDNYTYANIVQQQLVQELGAVDRGLDPREKLVVIRETKMPAVIAELGFLTNEAERAKIATEDYRQCCAQALANAIKKYIDEVLIDMD